MKQEELNKLFKHTQVGRIVDCTVVPITNLYSLEDVRKLFVDNPGYSCIPVEMPSGNGLIFRNDVIHATKSFFRNEKLEERMNTKPLSFKANENVFQVLKDILANESLEEHRDFIVYYKKNYLGVGKFIDLTRYVNKLNSMDEKSAGELQQFLLAKSKFHNLPFKVSIYNKMTSSLGGDFYRVFAINENLALISIFDVAGKGLTGALSTFSISAFFSLLFEGEAELTDPDTIVSRLNSYIYDQTPFGIFITAILMFVDIELQKTLIYNLGHTQILSYKADENDGKAIGIDPKLPPLGIDDELPNLKNSKKELAVESNRKIVLYSDGLSEATDDYGVRYGEERVKKFFDDNIQRENEAIVSELGKEIKSFVKEAPLSDDITVLIVDLGYPGTEEKQKKYPLSTIPYLFNHSFDYSLHLYLSRSANLRQKMLKGMLLFSARKKRSLIISQGTQGSYFGYLITEKSIWAFDENRKFTQIELDTKLFNSLLKPLHLKSDWLQKKFSVKIQESSESHENSSTTHLLCIPEQSLWGISEVDILINKRHSVPFGMTINRGDTKECLLSKKWIQYREEFFPKEFSISCSRESDSQTKIYLSHYQQRQFDEDLFTVEYLKSADIKALYGE